MEALPKISMIKPNFRTSTLTFDNIPDFDFRSKTKEYILMHFQADPHLYDEAFDDLSAMKLDANCPAPTIESTCTLKRYYGQLCMLQKRFPMSPGQELETPFSWYDSMSENRHPNSDITFADVEYEKASVMFNIGACHAQIAAMEERETQDSIKNSFMHFQYAAFAFSKLNQERFEDQFYPSIDLDPQVLMFFEKVMMAQAQECLVQKSLLDNRTHIVIAKLSKWLQETFEECTKIVDDWNVNLSERAQKGYMKICQVKSDIYGTICYLSMGDHAEKEDKKMGYRLAYYKIACDYLNNVLKEKAFMEKYPEFLPTITFLADVVQAKAANAEKENNFIYHERVPKKEDLIKEFQEEGSMCKSKALAFNPLDRSVCGDDIFGTLLPPTVLQSVSIYEEKKAELKRTILAELFEADTELMRFLEKVGYNDLKWMLNDDKQAEKMFQLPDMLLERNAEMTAQPDAIPSLLEKLRESADTSRVAEAKLNTLISKLRAIDLPRLKNDEGYVLILNELTKLSEHLVTAKTNNVSLNKAIAAHSKNLQILSLPVHEMREKLTPVIPKTKSSKEEESLRRLMNKIEEMKLQRQKLIKQLEEELEGDDISKELLAQRDLLHDDIFDKEIKKHNDTLKYIRMNINAQENILHAFAEANADYCDERLQLNTYNEQFNNQVMVLVTAYDIFKDVVHKINDGETFYRQLMQRCDQFAIPIHAMEEQFRSEVEKKEKENRVHEERLALMKMQREVRNTMAEYGGVVGGQGTVFNPTNSRRIMEPSAPGNSAHPTLRDYMSQYRNRKTSSTSSNVAYSSGTLSMVPPINSEIAPGGPPSPTPSSICDFPVSPSIRGMSAPSKSSGFVPQSFDHSSFGKHSSPISITQIGQPNSDIRSSSIHQNPISSLNFHHSQAGEYDLNAFPSGYPHQQHQHQPHQNQPQQHQPQQHQPQHILYQPYQLGHQQQLHSQNTVAQVPTVQHNLVQPSLKQYSSVNQQTTVYPQNQPSIPITHTPYQENQSCEQQGAPKQFSPGNQAYNQYQQPTVAQASFAPVAQSGSNYNQQQVPPNSVGLQFQNKLNFNNQTLTGKIQQPQWAQQISENSYPQNRANHQSSLNPVLNGSALSQTLGTGGQQSPILNKAQGGQYNPLVPPTQQVQQGYLPAPVSVAASYSKPTSEALSTSHISGQTSATVKTSPHPPHQHQQQQQQSFEQVGHFVAQKNLTTMKGFDRSSNIGKSSPWHATPENLNMPSWNSSVVQQPQAQFHQQAEPQLMPQFVPPQPLQPPQLYSQVPNVTSFSNNNVTSNNTHNNGAQGIKSNVDLLSDLLGDFNLPPPLQPKRSEENNLQKAVMTMDIRPITQHRESDKKPAATVSPMPQQQSTIQTTSTSTTETPILSMNSATNVSFSGKEQLSLNDLIDPNKFEIGEGDQKKLEKRLLHHSIRTNSVPPPLNQNDPLNQINPFEMIKKS